MANLTGEYGVYKVSDITFDDPADKAMIERFASENAVVVVSQNPYIDGPFGDSCYRAEATLATETDGNYTPIPDVNGSNITLSLYWYEVSDRIAAGHIQREALRREINGEQRMTDAEEWELLEEEMGWKWVETEKANGKTLDDYAIDLTDEGDACDWDEPHCGNIDCYID